MTTEREKFLYWYAGKFTDVMVELIKVTKPEGKLLVHKDYIPFIAQLSTTIMQYSLGKAGELAKLPVK